MRALRDTIRVGKYLTSPSGLLWIVKENLHTVIPTNVVKSGDKLKRVPQKHHGLNPLSTLAATGGRLLGDGLPNVLMDRTDPFWYDGDKYLDGLDGKTDEIQQKFTSGTTKDGGFGLGDLLNVFGLTPEKYYKGDGDQQTLLTFGEYEDVDKKIYKDKLEDAHLPNDNKKIKGENEFPFYFQDLRDNAFIIFRAYIDGLTENISPSWLPTNYLGRSEPVYVYEQTERDISFNLKLFAQTKDELKAIYKKMNRLTSMCYPEYHKDEVGGTAGMQRMKPPIVKLRLGELFGVDNNEMVGYLKSISYTFDDDGVWETDVGKRVPKYISVSITYQVIHMKVPSLEFAKPGASETFYGTNQVKAGVGIGV